MARHIEVKIIPAEPDKYIYICQWCGETSYSKDTACDYLQRTGIKLEDIYNMTFDVIRLRHDIRQEP